jgi:hypothetical protein
MEPRILHGTLTPIEISQVLIAEFNHGNLRAQQLGDENHLVVQIASRDQPFSGGQTALSVTIQKVEDGISITLGKQEWLGVVADLSQKAFIALQNPWMLLNHLDDLAQDIENLQLNDRVWAVIEKAARTAGASYELSDRLRRVVCSYCDTANPVGEPNCIACGAPLGQSQPRTCKKCGFIIKTGEINCPNCGSVIS